MKNKLIITSIILLIFNWLFYYIWWIIWILEFIFSLSIYTIIFYFFHIIWAKIRKKEIMESSKFIKLFLYKVSILLVFTTTFIWWLSYLSNELYPAQMPEYTISNWEKEVKFQAMSHIWSESFYKEVQSNLQKHKENWWVYFFEWVKPWTTESHNDFNKAIWITFDEDLYKNFSKLYWLTFQDNSIFLWLINDKDFNVDIWLDQIMILYKWKTKGTENKDTNPPIEASKEIIKTLSQLNEKELKILVYINQAVLNFIIWSNQTQSFLNDNFTNKELFEVILDERNKVVANEVINTKYNKIYMTYWLLHFKWVLELLQKNNPNWKIIETKYLYPIKN